MSHETFHIGEIAEYRDCSVSIHAGYVGQECEIVGELRWRRSRHAITGLALDVYGYRTRARDGQIFTTEPHLLRKKRPPQDWKTLCSLNDAPADAPTRELEIA